MTSVEAKKEIAYVRGEKKEDDLIARKLEEVYGKVASTRDNGYRRSKKGWECASCGYVNYESRLACGECLELHPAVAEGTHFQKKGGPKKQSNAAVDNDDTSSTTHTISTSSATELLKRQPNIKQPAQSNDKFTKILQISGRCYRTADFPSTAVAMGRKKTHQAPNKIAPAQTEHTKQTDEHEDNGSDGFGTCSEGGDEDGPSGGCGGPGKMPAYGEVLEDYSDDDDAYDVDQAGSSTAASTSKVTIKRDDVSDSFIARMYISPLLYGFIIGKKGASLAETQRLTNTIIIVPKGTSDDQIITIKGPDRASVTAAVVRLEAIVMDNRSKVGFTHFISIPIGKDPAVRARAASVIADMKAALPSKESGIDASLFQDPSWMHWTVLVLRLHTERELELAKRLLRTEVQEAATKLLGGGAARTVRLEGLDIMNDDPKEVNVLFVRAKDGVDGKSVDSLRKLVSTVGEIFLKHNLCLANDVTRADKLHVTLMNSKFRAAQEGATEGKTTVQQRIPFNATSVLERFGNASFGDYALHSLELNRMNNHSVGDAAHQQTRSSKSYYVTEEVAEF